MIFDVGKGVMEMEININVNRNKSVSEIKEILKKEKVRVMMFNTDGSLTVMSSNEVYNHHQYFNEYYKQINKEIGQVTDFAKRLETSMDVSYLGIFNVVNNNRVLFLDFGRNNRTSVYGYFILPFKLSEMQLRNLQKMGEYFSGFREMQMAPVTIESGCAVLGEDIFVKGAETVLTLNELYVKDGLEYRLKSGEKIEINSERKQGKSGRRG